MPRVKTEVAVRVLYPSAFAAIGLDPEAEELEVDETQAAWLIGAGYAERVVVAPKKAGD
jgi:hypothetical protein